MMKNDGSAPNCRELSVLAIDQEGGIEGIEIKQCRGGNGGADAAPWFAHETFVTSA